VNSKADDASPACVEVADDQTFLRNTHNLRASDGFRQNVWLSFNQDSHAAICMDLNRQLYLVVISERTWQPGKHPSKRFSNLRISSATLRKRMDPDAFILDRDGIEWIFRIPPDAEESFAAELLNELSGLDLKPTDIGYGWD
jgi:hypothetical protein